MLDFVKAKSMIAEIVGCEETDVTIGFTHRTYDITFGGDVELGSEAKGGQPAGIAEAHKIVRVLGEAVQRTIEFWTWDSKSVTIVFGINQKEN